MGNKKTPISLIVPLLTAGVIIALVIVFLILYH